MKSANIKILLGTFGLAALGGFIVIWLGLFNVAATEKHWDITTNFLVFVRERSISANAQDISVPDLGDKNRIAKGAANYAAMCAQCHLAPGIDSSELYEGLYPQPPVLAKLDIAKREPKETFWIIKNGLKMTAMPAWGTYNSDEQIWDMIALIGALKDMSPQEYQKLVDAGEHTHANEHTSNHTKTNHSDDHHATKEETTESHSDKSQHKDDGHHH